MDNIEKILAMLEQMQSDITGLKEGQIVIKEQQNNHTAAILGLEEGQSVIKEQQNNHMAAILGLEEGQSVIKEQQNNHMAAILGLEEGQSVIKEQQNNHMAAILKLENSVMHELELLNENLPNAVVRNKQVAEMESKVDSYDHRIFALEQKVSNQ